MSLLISLLGLALAAVTFYYSFFRKSKEQFRHFQAQFRTNQKLSRTVQKNLSRYAEFSDTWDELIFEEFTIRGYLESMKVSYSENLSDELLAKIRVMDPSRTNLDAMIRDLENQAEALKELKTKSEMMLQKYNILLK